MNIRSMHTGIKLKLDKITSLTLPAFEPEEIDYMINEKINEFIDLRLSGYNNKGESFEENQRCIDDLRTLIVELPITSITVGGSSDKPNSYIINLSTAATNYLRRIGEEVTIRITSTLETKRQGVTECTSDSYRVMIDNPFSEHRLYLGEAKPLRLFKGNYIELITDGNYSITSYYLRYIKNPTTVSITTSTDCDLPNHTHSRIIDMVVAGLLENIESNRYQSFKTETSRSE